MAELLGYKFVHLDLSHRNYFREMIVLLSEWLKDKLSKIDL